MEKFAGLIVRHKTAVIVLFLILAAFCAVLLTTVQVNYTMADYLPPQAQSTKAVKLMNGEFSGGMPNAEVSLFGVSLMDALAFKRELEKTEFVTGVTWLDDVYDLKTPVEMGDKAAVEAFYKNETATYSVVVKKGNEKEAVRAVRELLGGRGNITGEAAEIEYVQSATSSEVAHAVLILVPLVVLILILSTSSWLEPLLFLAAIGMSVVINMGTNAFFENVSFLTNAVTPILQLAVSLDYAIFLLHSFAAHRKNGADVEAAMRGAVKESFSAVAASASTTLFGFMALLFMDFRIGADLGLSLAKGIIFSFISVMAFLPALTVAAYKMIDKTHHRELLPSFANVYAVFGKFAVLAVVIVAVIVVPCFLGQSRTDFMYGYEAAYEQMTQGAETEKIQTVMALLVPKGDIAREEALCRDAIATEHVTSVTAYALTVGSGIPPEFLDASVVENFYSDNYARIIVYTDTPTEGDIAFETVERVKAAAEAYYPGEVYYAGQAANMYDIKNVVQKDNRLTNLIAIVSIFCVLLVTFKSVSLPFFLLLTIETAIWLNLSIPYFTGTSINYIGYLVLNTVQLGATVDYAILLTVTYMRERRAAPKGEAMHKALGGSFRSILVSAATLATAGFVLAGTTSNPLIADIGMLLGRGTMLSMLMVAVFLPAMLTIFDKLTSKTTYKTNFLQEAAQ